MKEAQNSDEAFKIFTRHNVTESGSSNDGFIQYKGTNICMDFVCECGNHNHYDGYFAYEVECSHCGQFYATSCYVEMVKIKNSSGNSLKDIHADME